MERDELDERDERDERDEEHEGDEDDKGYDDSKEPNTTSTGDQKTGDWIVLLLLAVVVLLAICWYFLIPDASGIEERFPTPAVELIWIAKVKEYLEQTTGHFIYISVLFSDGIAKEQPYLKDSSGHIDNNINGKLKGLFFLPAADANRLPNVSYYGDTRIWHAAQPLLNPERCNYYFADYYCFGSNHHYMTIVVSQKNSERDSYCSTYLEPLNPYDNPFLQSDKKGKRFWARKSKQDTLEIFYTEEVEVDRAKFVTVKTKGNGEATGKISKLCELCGNSIAEAGEVHETYAKLFKKNCVACFYKQFFLMNLKQQQKQPKSNRKQAQNSAIEI